MALTWKREPWRKLYVREEGSFASLPLLARALAAELIKIADDHGVIHTGTKAPWEAIAFQLGAEPGERRMLRRLVDDLLRDGYLVHDVSFRIRNFRPAQMRWDRARGAHELSAERASAMREPSASGARTQPQPCAKDDPSAEDSAKHAVSSRSETKRSETSGRDAREGGDRYAKLADQIWAEFEAARLALQADGIGPGSRAPGPMHPAKSELVRRISEQAADGRGADVAAADCRHVLAVLVAEARVNRSLEWLGPLLWSQPAFTRTLNREVGSTFGKPRAATGTEPPKPGSPTLTQPLLYDGYARSKQREAEEKARAANGGAA